MYKHFTEDEVRGLSPRLVFMLDWARDRAGVPFRLTETVARGGSHVEDSSHEQGLAVDIACSQSRERFLILEALFWVGFYRVGIYDRHIHVDIDNVKPQQVSWLGTSH